MQLGEMDVQLNSYYNVQKIPEKLPQILTGVAGCHSFLTVWGERLLTIYAVTGVRGDYVLWVGRAGPEWRHTIYVELSSKALLLLFCGKIC